MKKNILKLSPLSTGVMLSAAIGAGLQAAEPPPAPAGIQKPAWLTETSLGIKEGYDNNVFLSGVDSQYLPASYPVPPGSVAALKNRPSWVTTISPKTGVNFIPLLGDQQNFQSLSLAYAPDFEIYHDQHSENYDAHRFMLAVKGGAGAVSFSVDNTFSFIDGDNFGPTYPGNYLNAYATATARERRKQIQDKAAVTFRYDWQHWFVRPTAVLAYYNLMTEQLNVSGYQSYVDRYDVNGGADLGFKVTSSLALTLGFREGYQFQQQFSYSPYSAPGDYQRVLLGIEGKPWQWLDIKIQGGPDFREYPGNTATHITPVSNTHPVKYYGEASLKATITTKDTLTFNYKQWQWVSSTGKVPYFDSTYALNYHRTLSDKLGFDLGGRILSSDYTSGNLSACRRDDWQYTVTAGFNYAFNSHLSASLAYQLDLGRNMESGVANPETREYDRSLTAFGIKAKF